MPNTLQQTFGNIDIYLFDQLLKGRFDNCQKILDAGCGGGRNLVYFLQQGHEVYGIDQSTEAIAEVRKIALQLAPQLPQQNFSTRTLEELPYPEAIFDLIICSAVLHFAHDEAHLDKMLRQLWRVLKPGGYFFARLATSIGIKHLVQPLGNSRYHLPDGSTRFLADEELLLRYTQELQGELFEPIKTTNVQNLRCMTTWCLRKKSSC